MRWAAIGATVLCLLYTLQTVGAAELRQDRLVIVTQSGERLEFLVEIAATGPERAKGLMFRETLADDAGMLFLYDDGRNPSMWMKNTLIALDMLFIDRSGRIVELVAETEPHSLRPISSRQAATAVLELKGGIAQRLGIATGDEVLHPAFSAER